MNGGPAYQAERKPCHIFLSEDRQPPRWVRFRCKSTRCAPLCLEGRNVQTQCECVITWSVWFDQFLPVIHHSVLSNNLQEVRCGQRTITRLPESKSENDVYYWHGSETWKTLTRGALFFLYRKPILSSCKKWWPSGKFESAISQDAEHANTPHRQTRVRRVDLSQLLLQDKLGKHIAQCIYWVAYQRNHSKFSERLQIEWNLNQNPIQKFDNATARTRNPFWFKCRLV